MAVTTKKGEKGREYHQAVSDLIASGDSPGEAIKQVAKRSGTTPSNVSNAYYRVQRQQAGNGEPIRSYARTSSSGVARTTAVPQDLEPLLDAIRKDRQSLSNNIDALIAWAQGQEAKTRDAVAEAREAAIRQIREAAAGLK